MYTHSESSDVGTNVITHFKHFIKWSNFTIFHNNDLLLVVLLSGLVGKKVFDVCKPTLKVINVARGGIVDEADLLEALNDGKCGGAALDVFLTEPPTGKASLTHFGNFNRLID